MRNCYLRLALGFAFGATLALIPDVAKVSAQDMGAETQTSQPGGLGGALSGALDKAGGALNSATGGSADQGTGVLTAPVKTKYRTLHTHTFHPGKYTTVTHHYVAPPAHTNTSGVSNPPPKNQGTAHA